MVTQQEIDQATGEQIPKLGLRLDVDSLTSFQQSASHQDAKITEQVAVLERIAAALESEPVGNKKQMLWQELYAMHLKTRLGPAIITSTTHQDVIRDLVLDAVQMTNDTFPLVLAQMASLDPSNPEWV